MRQLYAAQKIFKITDHYFVTDEGGYTVYQVDENYRVLGKNMNVTNVETGVQFMLERQLGLGTVFNVGFSTGDQLYMRKRFKLAGLNIEAYLNQTPLQIGGSFWEGNFEIVLEGGIVAAIHKPRFKMRDKYQITVYDQRFQDVAIAVLIVVDCLSDQRQKNRPRISFHGS